jgi:hypothetical protein
MLDSIIYVDLKKSVVVLGDEPPIPITNWIIDGEETYDDNEKHRADSVVAGPTQKGEWIAVVVQDYEKLL